MHCMLKCIQQGTMYRGLHRRVDGSLWLKHTIMLTECFQTFGLQTYLSQVTILLWGTKWQSQVLAHWHYRQLMHLQEQKTEVITNYCVASLYSIVTFDDCCDSPSLPPLIFPAISVDWYYFNVNMASLLLLYNAKILFGIHFRVYLQHVPSFHLTTN